VPDANEVKLLASRQEQAFQEKFGYPASEVPGIWVGQHVSVNMLGGRGGDRQLAPTRASGMLEAISLDGIVLSVEDRVVFRALLEKDEPFRARSPQLSAVGNQIADC
jgi:hypothetical protein